MSSDPRPRTRESGALELFSKEPSQARLEAVLRTHAKLVFQVAHRTLRDTHLVEDAVQEFVLAILSSRPRTPIVNERALVTRIAQRVALKILRSRSRAPELREKLPEVPVDDGHPELRTDIRDAIRRLPPDLGEIAEMIHVRCLDRVEIAETLGASLRTIDRRLLLIRQRLATELGAGYTAEIALALVPLDALPINSLPFGEAEANLVRRAFRRALDRLRASSESDRDPESSSDGEGGEDRARLARRRAAGASVAEQRSGRPRTTLALSIGISTVLFLLLFLVVRGREELGAEAGREARGSGAPSTEGLLVERAPRPRSPAPTGPTLEELLAGLRQLASAIDWSGMRDAIESTEEEPPTETILRVRARVDGESQSIPEKIGQGVFSLLTPHDVDLGVEDLMPGVGERYHDVSTRVLVRERAADWCSRDQVITDERLLGIVLIAEMQVHGQAIVRSLPFRLEPGTTHTAELVFSVSRPVAIRTLDAISGEPIPNVLVEFVDLADRRTPTLASDRSDANGSCVIFGLPETRYLVQFWSKTHEPIGQRVEEALGDELTLWIHPKAKKRDAARVTVEVFDLEGRPWPGVSLAIRDERGRSLGVSDESGKCVFEEVPHGKASAEIQFESTELRDRFDVEERARSFNAQPGQRHRVIVGRAPTSSVVEIRVLDTEGRGRGDVHISLQGTRAYRATTDETGLARFEGVEPGQYRLYRRSGEEHAVFHSLELVDVDADDTVRREIAIGDAIVRGRVKARGDPKLPVMLTTPGRDLLSFWQINPEGVFAFQCVPPGKYLVRCGAHASGYTTFSEKEIEVTEETETIELFFDVDVIGRLLVNVIGADGRVVPGVTGRLSVDGREQRLGPLRTGLRMTELYTDAPAGLHTFEVSAPGHVPVTRTVELFADETVEVDVTLVPGP